MSSATASPSVFSDTQRAGVITPAAVRKILENTGLMALDHARCRMRAQIRCRFNLIIEIVANRVAAGEGPDSEAIRAHFAELASLSDSYTEVTTATLSRGRQLEML